MDKSIKESSLFRKEKCSKCEPTDFTKIGKSKDAGTDSINDNTLYHFHQCNKCGSIWIEIKESGVCGHGHFFHILSDKYF